MNFTAENNVHKGLIEPYPGTFKSVGEMAWKRINSFSDKIMQVNQYGCNIDNMYLFS